MNMRVRDALILLVFLLVGVGIAALIITYPKPIIRHHGGDNNELILMPQPDGTILIY